MINEKDLHKKALELWGAQTQIMMLIEEMAELTTELCHEIRGRGKIDAMIEELADVDIMLGQIKSIFPSFEQIKQKKLERLNSQINRIVGDQ